METWAVTGASGSIGSECIIKLIENGNRVVGFSRRKPLIENENLYFSEIAEYRNIDFSKNDFRGIIVAQGFFCFKEIEKIQDDDLDSLISGNFITQIEVVRSFLRSLDKSKRVDVVILGSTSAYVAGKGTTVYGAAKSGMLGFVKALNDEYINTDVRFWFISTGTLANEMGAKVPNQDPNSLLDPGLVAKRIIETVTSESNLWEPEITIRRRHIKLVN